MGSVPDRAAIVEKLFAPLLRQRDFSAPSPAYALATLADWAKGFPEVAFSSALDELKRLRKVKVYGPDIEAALKNGKALAERDAGVAAAKEKAERQERSDPMGTYRQGLADRLVACPLGLRAAHEDWLPELQAWCAEIGALPTTPAEIATVIAKRDERVREISERLHSPAPTERKFAESMRVRRGSAVERLHRLLGLPVPVRTAEQAA